MAGILNNKERVIDFILTEEGKRQASSGQMKIEFAAFTDLHTFYEASSSLGADPIANPDVAADASNRIYFEATNRFQDVIVPELEAGNSMRPFKTEDFSFDGTVVASGTVGVGFSQRVSIVTGAQVPLLAERALNGITKNFQDLRLLGTHDEFSDTSAFSMLPMTASFNISNTTNFNKTLTGNALLESIPSLFSDRRFAHFPNFTYLPPRNVPLPGSEVGTPLGKYPKLNEPEDMSFSDLEARLADKSYVKFNFVDTSRDNNIVAQVFEFSTYGVEKLSIVDFGEFDDDDPFSPGKRVFFVGKMLRDVHGSETFLNVFTLVFD